VIHSKRFRELMHVKHKQENGIKILAAKLHKKHYLGDQVRDRHTKMI
jgi:hypothetical protein